MYRTPLGLKVRNGKGQKSAGAKGANTMTVLINDGLYLEDFGSTGMF